MDVLWLFLTVPWVGLQCVIVVFPDHTQLLFANPFSINGFAHRCSYIEDEIVNSPF